MAFSLLSLNTEGNVHFNAQIPFLQQQSADVVCLQEVFRADLPILENVLGSAYTYVPQATVQKENPFVPARGDWGVLIATKLPILNVQSFTYVGEDQTLPIFFEKPEPGNTRTMQNSMNRVAIALTVQDSNGEEATIITTHFTWSPNGTSTPEQRDDALSLKKHLARYPRHILCGDLNAPRGGQTFALISEGYEDALPADIVSTLDPVLHRAGHLQFAVDALLAHHEYDISNVEAHTGVSDHKAITARVKKKAASL